MKNIIKIISVILIITALLFVPYYYIFVWYNEEIGASPEIHISSVFKISDDFIHQPKYFKALLSSYAYYSFYTDSDTFDNLVSKFDAKLIRSSYPIK